MTNKYAGKLSFSEQVSKDEIAFAFRFLLGTAPSEDSSIKLASFIANCTPNARVELLRNIIDQAPDLSCQAFLPLFLDRAVRLKVFANKGVPKVNLFCVGAPRCGTTTLSLMMSQNPDVFLSPIKETNFFSHMWIGATPRGVPLDIYELYYSGWEKQSVLADFTPIYLMYKHAIDGIHTYNPDAKMIVCLRDPVERALSAFFYTRPYHKQLDALDYFGPTLTDFSMEQSTADEWFSARALLRQSFYHADISYLRTRFKDVLLVTFSELADLTSLNQRVCAFAGIAPADTSWASMESGTINSAPKDTGERVEQAKAALSAFFAEDRRRLKEDFGVEI